MNNHYVARQGLAVGTLKELYNSNYFLTTVANRLFEDRDQILPSKVVMIVLNFFQTRNSFRYCYLEPFRAQN